MIIDPSLIEDREANPVMEKKILDAAKLILVLGFIVTHWMIDKARANLNALLRCK